MADEPVRIVAGETDQAKAERYRDAISKHLTAVSALMTEARRSGLIVSFNVGGPDGLGQHFVASLEISKKLA